MATADSTQRQSSLSLARYRAEMQKLKLTLAVVPGGANKYGEICMALRVLLQLIDESFTSSIKTLKWDINSGKVMGLSPILERASVLTGIFCSRLSNLSEQFCKSGEVLVADGSIRERGSPNADRSAFRKLTPEHEAAIKTFIDYRNSSQGAGKVRLFHHVTYIEPPCLCVLPFAPPPLPPSFSFTLALASIAHTTSSFVLSGDNLRR